MFVYYHPHHPLNLLLPLTTGKMSPLGVRGRFVINKEVLQLSISANQHMEMVTIHSHHSLHRKRLSCNNTQNTQKLATFRHQLCCCF